MFDSVIDFSVKTIVSVLSSSVTCGVLQFHNEHVLLVGSSIPLHGCLELVDVCSDVLVKLDERGGWAIVFNYFKIVRSFICFFLVYDFLDQFVCNL